MREDAPLAAVWLWQGAAVVFVEWDKVIYWTPKAIDQDLSFTLIEEREGCIKPNSSLVWITIIARKSNCPNSC
jgi:hypothetical protein